MTLNYFDFNGLDNPLDRFMIYNGYLPDVKYFVPNYLSYTEVQQKNIDKQFYNELFSWWNAKKVTYSPTKYIQTANHLLDKLQKLSEEERLKFAEKIRICAEQIQQDSKSKRTQTIFEESIFAIKNLESRETQAANAISQLTKSFHSIKASWEEIRIFFHDEMPLKGIESKEVENALADFDEKMTLKAMSQDLFNVKNAYRSLFSDRLIRSALIGLKNLQARQAFFRGALAYYPFGLEVVSGSFQPEEIKFILLDKITEPPFARDIPEIQLIEFILKNIQENPHLKRKHLTVTFKERLHFCLRNQVFPQYIAEMSVIYSQHIKKTQNLDFYLPLKLFVDEFEVVKQLEKICNNQQPLFYTSKEAIIQFMENYEAGNKA